MNSGSLATSSIGQRRSADGRPNCPTSDSGRKGDASDLEDRAAVGTLAGSPAEDGSRERQTLAGNGDENSGVGWRSDYTAGCHLRQVSRAGFSQAAKPDGVLGGTGRAPEIGASADAAGSEPYPRRNTSICAVFAAARRAIHAAGTRSIHRDPRGPSRAADPEIAGRYIGPVVTLTRRVPII